MNPDYLDLRHLSDKLANELERLFETFGSVNKTTLETEWSLSKWVRGKGSPES